MEDTQAVVQQLTILVEVTRQGQRDLKDELKELRSDLREGLSVHDGRLSNVERGLSEIRGALQLVKALAGTSIIGALLTISATVFLEVSRR